MKAVLHNTFHLFALLGIIFIPAASYVLPFQNKFAVWVFGDLVNLMINDHLDFSSDSIGLNILLLLLYVLAALIALGLSKLSFWKERQEKYIRIIQLIIFYYLASRMMVYGFDKVFKTQFYMPEPNILYTRLGMLNKDILFWSAMGSSKWYCILSGIAEVIPAVFLLFKRTRLIGLLWMVLVLMHVLTINIGFDISVKLYSLFLLYLTGLLLSPHLKTLYDFFIRKENARLQKPVTILEGKSHIKRGLKFFVVGMIFIEALKFPISSGYFSDDDVPRPFLHGAYIVRHVESDNPEFAQNEPWVTRFYIHRRNYLIFEYSTGDFDDYPLQIDQERQVFSIEVSNGEMNEIPYRLYCDDECLDLGMINGRDTSWYVSYKADLNELPALQDDFHWTIDEFMIEE